MRPVTYNYSAATTTSLAQSQAGTSGVALTLNTIVRDGSNFGLTSIAADGGTSQRSVSLTSTANASSILFTIAGLDMWNALQSYTLTGPNNNTVYTNTGMTVVNSITPNASYISASGVYAGFGTSGVTKWFIPSTYVPDFSLGVGVEVSGSLTYTLQQTFDNLFTTTSPRVHNCDDATFVNATTSGDTNYAFPVGGISAVVTGTGSGFLSIEYIQAWH